MAINIEQLRIVLYPDPVLHRKAEPIKQITDEVVAVAEKMLQLMHENRGVGLAGPQVGLSWRLFVTNHTTEPKDNMVFINPTFIERSDRGEPHEEGCLSIPNVSGVILRPYSATIEATDLNGQLFTVTSDQLPARIWQHEMDHLDGIRIIDRMSPTDKLASRSAIKELESRFKN